VLLYESGLRQNRRAFNPEIGRGEVESCVTLCDELHVAASWQVASSASMRLGSERGNGGNHGVLMRV
jgi:hypothetical protein